MGSRADIGHFVPVERPYDGLHVRRTHVVGDLREDVAGGVVLVGHDVLLRRGGGIRQNLPGHQVR